MTSKILTQEGLEIFPNLTRHVILIILVALALDVFVELIMQQHNLFILKNLINLSLILGMCVLAKKNTVTLYFVLAFSCYSVIGSMMISLFNWDLRHSVGFSTFYLKFEVISWLLVLAAGFLMNRRHLIYLIFAKSVFILLCCYSPFNEVDPIQYIMFFFFNIAVGYLIWMASQKISANIEEEMIREKSDLKSPTDLSKFQLLHILGHDVKQPLSQLSTLVDLIEKEDSNIPKKEVYELMHQSVDSGMLLISNFVSWAEASGTSEIQTTCQIQDCIEEALDYNKSALKLKNISIERLYLNQRAQIDSRALLVVVRNLLSNAIKYSYQDSLIRIFSVTNDSTIRISIEDHGIGMDEAQKERLNQAGKKQSVVGTANEIGTGFGLEICKDILARNQGELIVESAINKGTTATIVIPLA